MSEKKTKSRESAFVVDRRPENQMGCPVWKIDHCVSTFCNPNECSLIVSVAEVICPETSDMYLK